MVLLDADSTDIRMNGARRPYLGAFLDNCLTQEQAGYPKARAVLMGMGDIMLERERATMLRASFDRMFGHNARKMLVLIEEEISQRGANWSIRSIFD